MFVCPYKACGKIYSTKYSLQRHCLIRHKKSKRFTCKVCKKILSSNQNLKEHAYTHTDEKPLICPYNNCGLVFRQSSQLSAHKKFHLLSGSAVKSAKSRACVSIDFSHLKLLLSSEAKIEETEALVGTEMLTLPKLFDPEELRAYLSRLK